MSGRRLARLIVVFCLLVLGTAPAHAQATDVGAPAISEAHAAALCDQAGNVLWAYNAEEELPPASITKVMTAMVALDSGKPLSDLCAITPISLPAGAQMAGLTAADTPTFEELLRVMLVYSANDAAINVAINVAGSEAAFVERMNAKAAELGMEHTHFMNTHGLEETGHYSSAADLIVMGRHAMQRYPFIARTVALRSTTIRIDGVEKTFESTDDLMDTYPGLLGIKTGAVESGNTFLGASHRSNLVVYSSVLGCPTKPGRFADTATMMNWAYDTYRPRTFAQGGWVLRICGFADNFALKCLVRVPADGVSGLVWPAGEGITYKNVLHAHNNALVTPGQAVGSAWWRQDGRLVAGTTWNVERGLYRLPGWSQFSLPLFLKLPPQA